MVRMYKRRLKSRSNSRRPFPIAGSTPQKPGQHSAEPSTCSSIAPHSAPRCLSCHYSQSRKKNPILQQNSNPPAAASFASLRCQRSAHWRVLSVRLLRAIMKTLEPAVQPTTDTKKLRERTVSSDNAKSTIVLNLPGVRLAVLTSAYDSLLHLDVTLSSASSLLLATYVACVLAWNILSVVLTLLAHTAAFALISFYTFIGLAMLSMNNATTSTTASVRNYFDHISDLEKRTPATASTSTLPLLSVIPSKSTQADGASASKRKAPAARRRVLAHLNRNRLLVNVVPGDMRSRVDMNLGEANIRVGKAFLQSVPGKRKPRDIYVVRVDCGAQSATQEKHMNPVIMWDVTATFDEFKQLERDLKKELKTLKQPRGVKVPHLSSGAVLFVQPELTDHVLNARRARLQTFIDAVRSDPVLSSMGCLRKFCQAY